MQKTTSLNTVEQKAKQAPFYPKYPEDISRQLDGYDLRLLEEIDFLSRCQAKKSIIGAKYCTPSEKYLSKKSNLSRENVSRHITKLKKLGILSVTHRRPKNGRWTTNLYKIVSYVFWRVGGFLKRLRSRPHRVTPATHIAIPVRENKAFELPSSISNEVKGILERWRSRAT